MIGKESSNDRTRYLTALAAGLCNDAGVELEVRDDANWGWDPIRRVIAVPTDDLLQRGQQYCAGVIAHEVGHIWISRYLAFQDVINARPPVRMLLNALEDPRVDGWMQLRYPGTTAWFQQLLEEPAEPTEPLANFLRFCLECVREPAQGWQPTDCGDFPDDVHAALAVTRVARKDYTAAVPAVDLSADYSDIQLDRRYRDEVWPRLTARAQRYLPDRREQYVRLTALGAFDLAKETIFPHALALLDDDVEQLGRYLGEDDRLAAQARAALREALAPVLAELAKLAGRRRKVHAKALSTLARRTLEAAIEEIMHPSSPTLHSDPHAALKPLRVPLVLAEDDIPAAPAELCRLGRSTSEIESLPNRPLPQWQASRYERAAADVRGQIDELTERIEAILVPRRRLGRKTGYTSGHGIDLRRLMQYQADPRRWDKLWWRTTMPERRDAAMLLLTDLSGSMRGGKDEAAMLGTILFVESLERLGVPCAVFGFQDALIPIREFGDPFDEDVRNKIAAMPLEVHGECPGGNNKPAYNDDGPCLLEAADILSERAEQDRILVSISDGYPEGRRSNANDLHRAVRQVAAPPYELTLLGVGLGLRTEHVAQFYPQAISDVPVDQFAARFGELLASILLTHEPYEHDSRGNP